MKHLKALQADLIKLHHAFMHFRCEDDDECALGLHNCHSLGPAYYCRNTQGQLFLYVWKNFLLTDSCTLTSFFQPFFFKFSLPFPVGNLNLEKKYLKNSLKCRSQLTGRFSRHIRTSVIASHSQDEISKI